MMTNKANTTSIRYAISQTCIYIRIGNNICSQLGWQRDDTIELIKGNNEQWTFKKAVIELETALVPQKYMGKYIRLRMKGLHQKELRFTSYDVSLHKLSGVLKVVPHEVKDDCLIITIGK